MKRPPNEGSASDKIKAILKYEPDNSLALEAEKPPRKRPNDAFPSP